MRYRYLKAETAAQDLALVEAREKPFGTADIHFPGYYGFNLTRARLTSIFGTEIASWKTALSAVAGVYVITDVGTGDSYVGSAYGLEGLWGRWKGYHRTLHNENRLLREHVERHGPDKLQYSVLLTMDIRSSADEVIAREGFFKAALGTRVHGLNLN